MWAKVSAEQLMEATRLARPELEIILAHPDADRAFVEEHLKKYCVIRLMMEEEDISDNITKMVRTDVARSMGVEVSKLEAQDMPGACGSAPAVLSKRILLFLAVQRELGIKLPPDDTPKIQTVQDLADMVIPLLREAKK